MMRSIFYVCPMCGNTIHSMGESVIHCHGVLHTPCQAEETDENHMIFIEKVEDEYYIGLDMVFPNFALAQGEKISQEKKIAMVNKQKKMMTTIAKQGLLSKMFKKQTIDASGLMSGDILSDDEKKLYKELYYKNITNEEVFEESILATENAKKAASRGVIKCPACFFISNMRGLVNRITWQDAGKEYAKQCGGEVHMTDKGHMFYNYISDELAKIIKVFLKKFSGDILRLSFGAIFFCATSGCVKCKQMLVEIM